MILHRTVTLLTLTLLPQTSGLPWRNRKTTAEGGEGEEEPMHALRESNNSSDDDDACNANNVDVDVRMTNSTTNTNTLSTTTTEQQQQQQILADELLQTSFHTKTRRKLHAVPELMYNEAETSKIIRETLDEYNITYTTNWGVNIYPEDYPAGHTGGYGLVADIGTGHPPCVLLRADMDALPILEETEFFLNGEDLKSQNDGKMHACGHDGHTTMLLGAAVVLKQLDEMKLINGTIRLMFQPAEEGGAGGKRMREEGVLDLYPPVQHAYGMHLWPTLPTGTIAGRPGAILAGADSFEITLSGVGGHAAMPHLTVDPVLAASSIVTSLQSIVSRNISPLDSGVVSVTVVQAGEAFNVIPDKAVLKGTIRALSTEALVELRSKVESLTKGIGEAHGCSVSITFWKDFYPPTVNDAELWDFASGVAASVSVDGMVRDVPPTMGAEDFSFIAEAVPSTFFLVGQGSASSPHPPSSYGLHHPHFAIDEDVLPIGSQLHVELALKTLEKLNAAA
uniref:Peptidase M20 dimerisation domain-containing protein n=1 Tax=Leptocylindrus danicus TaxID=163516 RepID=A0A7S2KG16_9STRA|mmetsp:Transcript_2224/g.3278  ORF Transcript_2224/g.3278 Transcript_2224/m.3278 type:complete len:508 (+) Transcript_2224:19-1542(+)